MSRLGAYLPLAFHQPQIFSSAAVQRSVYTKRFKLCLLRNRFGMYVFLVAPQEACKRSSMSQ